MTKFALLILILTCVAMALVFLILLLTNQHEDDTVWLDSFLDQCRPTPKNKALAEAELDQLRYKVSEQRIQELVDKFNYVFNDR